MLSYLKVFVEKISEKLAFLTQPKAKLFINLIISFFEKNENWQTSQKIVIITSTNGLSLTYPNSIRFTL
jgi:hypothetical protein